MDHIKLTNEVLSVDEVTSLVSHPSCGAISLFIGTTRDNFQGKDVIELAYEAYQDMAEKEMHKLCTEAREKWSLKHISLHHRLGIVPVTESSVIIAVSSEHRRESLEAVTFLIDGLKAKVPIWKKEIYGDGSSNWKRNKECTWAAEERGKGSAVDKKEGASTNKRSLSVESDGERMPLVKRIKEISNVSEPEDSNSLKRKTHQDSDFVQITASKQEINRRIAAFQQHKREELDLLNIQEFCSLSRGPSSHTSCARTSAVVLRSKGSSSHLKLTHVVNDWGPQTLGMDPGSVSTHQAKEIFKQEDNSSSTNGNSKDDTVEPSFHSSKEFLGDSQCKQETRTHPEEAESLPGIEERLHNLESHLRILPGAPIPRSVYARLKALEDRVLYLEGISPEYFRNNVVTSSRRAEASREVKATKDDICLNELDMKIHELKVKLKQKQIKQEG